MPAQCVSSLVYSPYPSKDAGLSPALPIEVEDLGQYDENTGAIVRDA